MIIRESVRSYGWLCSLNEIMRRAQGRLPGSARSHPSVPPVGTAPSPDLLASGSRPHCPPTLSAWTGPAAVLKESESACVTHPQQGSYEGLEQPKGRRRSQVYRDDLTENHRSIRQPSVVTFEHIRSTRRKAQVTATQAEVPGQSKAEPRSALGGHPVASFASARFRQIF